MPVSPSYPGLYIEELPLSAHTIAAAPTSIAAFVGYTHPYKTKAFRTSTRIFGFSEYEAAFGGLFSSGVVDPSLPRAVYNFFANGGSDAYVVGLQPEFRDAAQTPVGDFADPQFTPTAQAPAVGANLGIIFRASELTDQAPMRVSITNLRSTAPGSQNTFDVAIVYGSSIETFRGIVIGGDPAQAPDVRINAQPSTPTKPQTSNLATASAMSAGFGTSLPPLPSTGALNVAFTWATPAAYATSVSGQDYIDIFQPESSLDKVEIFNLLLTPGVSDNAVLSAAMAFAERKRAFAIIDPPANAVADSTAASPIDSFLGVVPRSQNAALYFPYLNSTDPVTAQPISVAPSGYVAGIYARTDTNRGVWKAPAGLETTLLNTTGPVSSGLMNDPRHGVLNLESINCLRAFSGIGSVVFGSRTLVADNPAYAQSKYVPVRRMTLFLEQTLLANLRWVVFEPNDEPLWVAIRSSIESFLLSLFNQGALQGSTPSQAFQVKCDSTTTTSDDQQNGIVNIVVAFAPLKPAEFVIIKIAQLAGQSAA